MLSRHWEKGLFIDFRILIINVCVGFPPEITHGPQNQSVTAGSIAQLQCRVTGAPKPTIVWSKGTAPFSFNTEKK